VKWLSANNQVTKSLLSLLVNRSESWKMNNLIINLFVFNRCIVSVGTYFCIHLTRAVERIPSWLTLTLKLL
jgi:hypothetical protein